MSPSEEAPLLVYSLDQAYKYRWTSRVGLVYCGVWASYVASDFFLNPAGAIAGNVVLVGAIGFTSFCAGTYLLSTFSAKTVRRLELLDRDTLRITVYNMWGETRSLRAPVADVVHLTAVDDKSALKTFALKDDLDRAYLTLVEEEANVGDRAAFNRVVHGIRPPLISGRSRRSKRRYGGKRLPY